MGLLKNLYTAGKAAYAATKAGQEMEVSYKIPLVQLSNFGATMEFCSLMNVSIDLTLAVRDIFRGFDEETQHKLTFSPAYGAGGWAERARFWQENLKPVLPPKQYYAAMQAILRDYARNVKRHSENKKSPSCAATQAEGKAINTQVKNITEAEFLQ